MEPLPSEHEPPGFGSQSLVGLLMLQAIGIAALLLFFAPNFAEFYKDFSGGQGQLPQLTAAVLSASATLLKQPIIPVFVLLLIGGALVRLRDLDVGWPLLLLLNLLMFAVSAAILYGLYLPIYGLVNVIK